MKFDDVADLIGNTPLVNISHLSPNPAVRIFGKVEGANPTGSLKDRIARSMIEEAQDKGLLEGEPILLEPTSGNTGVSLAFFAQRLGLRLVCVMPDSATPERTSLIEAFGAKVVYSPGEKGSNGAIEMAKRMAEDDRYLMLYQYGNEANTAAHYSTTGPEILADMPSVTHFVAGLGTGGTLMGVGSFLKERRPEVEIIAAEPRQGESVYGLRSLDDGFIPPIFDPEVLDSKMIVGAADSVVGTQTLSRQAGLFAGISSGAVLHVAQRVAKKVDGPADIVCLFADGGWKYLSTGIWSQEADDVAEEVEKMPW